jgi:hypothetical protein
MSEGAYLEIGGETDLSILDVSGAPLEVIFGSDHSVFSISIRSLLESDSKGESYAGHSSSV